MARIQKGVNDLESWCLNNGKFGQKLMTEWIGIRDDGRRYAINQVSFGSNKKFKWKCSDGHEWLVTINSRTAYKTSCPYCSGKRVSNENNLKIWCLNNGEFGKQLIQEWTGECDDGTHYRIDEVFKGSHKKFKWRCNKDHEWWVDVHNRTGYRTSCPYCNERSTSYAEQFIYWSLKQVFPNTETRCKVLKSSVVI